MGFIISDKVERKKLYLPSRKLIRFSREGDFFRLRNAFEGLALWGGIGSGKSSVINQIAQCYFETGMGGLCLGPKADFEEAMSGILARAGALDRSLALRDGQNGINLIRAESEIFGSGNGLEENISDSLFSGVEVVTRNYGSATDPFWQAAARQMCKNLVVLDMKANGGVDVRRLKRMMDSLPRYEHIAGEWSDRECLVALKKVIEDANPGAEARVDMAIDYVLKVCPGMAEKTIASVKASLDVVLDVYCRDTVYNAICHDSGRWKLSDLREKGLIIVSDFPVKGGYDVTGLVIGASLKRAVGKQIERELKLYPVPRRDEMRPVAFIIDDAGQYANSDDLSFLSTSREARACSVWAFQTLGLMRDQFGGADAGLNKAKTTVGFLKSVMGFESDDEETNRHYSGKRGERLEKREGGSTGESTPQRVAKSGPQLSEGTSYQFVPAPDLPYYAYVGLKRGGTENSGKIEAILTMPQRFKGNPRRWMKLDVFQEPRPGTRPQSLAEWFRWLIFRWNHFTRRPVFVWLDARPRLRIWNGHVSWLKVAGWLLVDRERGKKLLRRWVNFWFLEREIAVTEEEKDHAIQS